MVKVDWDGIIPALLEKKCDAIVASMSATDERKQVIDFTGQVLPRAEPLRRRRPIPASSDTPEGLAGKVVGVQRGTIHQNYMEAHYPDTELRLYGTQDEMMLDLTAGRIDAVMASGIALDGGLPEDAGRRGLRLPRRASTTTRRSTATARRSACARRTPSCATS